VRRGQGAICSVAIRACRAIPSSPAQSRAITDRRRPPRPARAPSTLLPGNSLEGVCRHSSAIPPVAAQEMRRPSVKQEAGQRIVDQRGAARQSAQAELPDSRREAQAMTASRAVQQQADSPSRSQTRFGNQMIDFIGRTGRALKHVGRQDPFALTTSERSDECRTAGRDSANKRLRSGFRGLLYIRGSGAPERIFRARAPMNTRPPFVWLGA